MRVAMVFPGQGTQTPGMGAPWQDHPAWKLLEQAEGALDEPLRALVTNAPAEQLARTRDAQLAVLCTSLVAWEAVRPLVDDVVAFAGHSLGQVTALVASGALDLEDGVRFAARREYRLACNWKEQLCFERHLAENPILADLGKQLLVSGRRER